MEIEDRRLQIDRIDSQILQLLNQRASFSIEIGKIKERQNLPIHSPEREKHILRKMVEENPGPLNHDGVQRIFERIIDESRKIERENVTSEFSREEQQ